MAGMTFEDLPPRASEIPLTNRRVAADVIDLIIGDTDRASGCVALMICDAEDRGIQPILLHDVPPDATAGGLAQLLGMLLPLVADNGGSVLIGRGRPRGRRPTTSTGPGTSWRSTGAPSTTSTCSASTSPRVTGSSGCPSRSPPRREGARQGTTARSE